MNRPTRLLSSRRATRPEAPLAVPILERELLVRALVEQCGRLTSSEAASLHNARRVVENEPEILARIDEGVRLADEAHPDAVREASDAAKWAYIGTLHIPAREVLQLAHDPIHGPVIAAIWAHATAVAARDVIPVDLAEAMSGPWLEAFATEGLTFSGLNRSDERS